MTGQAVDALENLLGALARTADDDVARDAHVAAPILALLRAGDHGDDLDDAIAHVARCAPCRARLVAGEVGARDVVVVAIEAPPAKLGSIAGAALASQARLVERGPGRFTAVVDVDRADRLKSELEKDGAPLVTRLAVGAPVRIPLDETSTGGRAPMPSVLDVVPREPGTDAAEIEAWSQLRRVPKQRAATPSPWWALFAIAAIACAMVIAYALAIRG